MQGSVSLRVSAGDEMKRAILSVGLLLALGLAVLFVLPPNEHGTPGYAVRALRHAEAPPSPEASSAHLRGGREMPRTGSSTTKAHSPVVVAEGSSGDASDLDTALDAVPWRKHVELLSHMYDWRQGSAHPPETDTEGMKAMALLMADLGPVFRASGVTRVEALMALPSVHARLLGAMLPSDSAASALTELTSIADMRFQTGDPWSRLVAAGEADLSLYRAARDRVSAGAKDSFEKMAFAMLCGQGEVRLPSVRATQQGVELLCQAWAQSHGLVLDTERTADVRRFCWEWWGDAERSLDDILPAGSVQRAAVLSRPPSAKDVHGVWTTEANLVLRLSMARWQSSYEPRLADALDAEARARVVGEGPRVLFIVGYLTE